MPNYLQKSTNFKIEAKKLSVLCTKWQKKMPSLQFVITDQISLLSPQFESVNTYKGTVAWDGFLSYSLPHSLDRMNKHFFFQFVLLFTEIWEVLTIHLHHCRSPFQIVAW